MRVNIDLHSHATNELDAVSDGGITDLVLCTFDIDRPSLIPVETNRRRPKCLTINHL